MKKWTPVTHEHEINSSKRETSGNPQDKERIDAFLDVREIDPDMQE